MSTVYCSKVFWVVHVNSRQYVTWKETRQEAEDYIGDNPWLVVVEEGSVEHLRDNKCIEFAQRRFEERSGSL